MLLLSAALALLPAQSQSTVFAYDPVGGQLFRAQVDPFGASLELVGPSGTGSSVLEALDFDAQGRHLWATMRDAGGGLEVGTLDLDEGHFVPRGTAPITGPVTDLAAAPDGATWYVAESVGGDAVVWRGHLPSGALTPWATLAGSGPLTGLSVDVDGRVVALRSVDGTFVALSAASAAPSSLGTLPPGSPLPFGLEYDWGTGDLLAMVDRAAPRLVRFDTEAGAEVPLSSPAGSPLMRLAVRRSSASLVTSFVCAPAVPNTTGSAARIALRGSSQPERNDLVLAAGSLPQHSFGLFLASLETASPVTPPGSVGRLCLGGSVGRIADGAQLLSAGSSGTFSRPVDLAALPLGGSAFAVVGVERLYFQAWYRDAAGGAATSNFTAAARVDVAPPVEGDVFDERGLPSWEWAQPTLVDLDGDGDDDVLVQESSSTTVVYWNVDGRLERDAVVSGVDRFLQTGDVDGDGDPDLVTRQGNSLAVGWNEGGAVSHWTTAASCWSIVQFEVHDLDADGRADLVYHCSPHNRVRVVFSEPGRTFTPAAVVHFVDDPGQVRGSDVDGDGYIDLMQSTAGRFELRYGLPGRSFQPGVALPGPSQSFSFRLFDVDTDGDVDVLFMPGVPSASGLEWLRNDNGNLVAAAPIPKPVGSLVRAAGDIDGDGVPDLLTTDSTPGQLSVLRGLGGFAYELLSEHVAGMDPVSFELADLDGDGRAEALVTDRDGEYVSLLGDSLRGTAAPHPEYAVSVATTAGRALLRAADFDDDGDIDLLVAGTAPIAPEHLLLRNQGDGTLSAPESIPIPRGAGDVEVADLNGDGQLDLLQVDSGASRLYAHLGDGQGGFATQPQIDLPTNLIPNHIAVGDIDGDGHVDVVCSQRGYLPLYGNGDGTFTAGSVVQDPDDFHWYSLELVDLDADGDLDLVSRVGVMGVVAWGNGNGGFEVREQIVDAYGPMAVADLDVDGRLDLLSVGYFSSSQPPARRALQRAGRTFDVAPFEISGNADEAMATDLDRDGISDLVLFFRDSNHIFPRAHLGTARGDGFGAFHRESWFFGRERIDGLLAVDLDGDGAPELCVFEDGRNTLSVLRGGDR